MARYARRAVAVSAVSAGLVFGFSATAWATSDASDSVASGSDVVATNSQDDKQQIQVDDTKPEGASATGSTTGRDLDPSGLMGEATSATRTALTSLGGTPSDSAATSERMGAGSQAATGSRTPASSEETGPSTSEAPEQSSEQAEVVAAPTAEAPAPESSAPGAPAAETAAEPTRTHQQQDVRPVGSHAEPTATLGSPEEAPVPTVDTVVTDTTAPVAQVVRTLPTTVGETVDTTVAGVGTRLAPLDRATAGGVTGLLAVTTPVLGSVTGGLTHVTTPVADTVDTAGTRVQTVVTSTTRAVGAVGLETGEVLCSAAGSAACVPGAGDSGAALPGAEDGAATLPVDGENNAETPATGDALPVLLGGLAFPMLPRGSDVLTLKDTLQTSAEETPDGASHNGGLDQSVPGDGPRPMGPEGNGPGPIVGGAAPIASTLVDVRLPDAHHAAAVPADVWRLPGSVTFEPGHSPD